MKAIHEKNLSEIAQDLAQGQYSSVECVQHFLDRIKKFNSNLNSFVTVVAESALAQAQAADTARALGDPRPLLGIPLAHKDIFCTNGVRTACGSKMLDNFVAPYDATVVARLQAAGLVMLGKTNMDEFAMGSSNETSFYGAVKNPWQENTVPGGSSGGSAAAVAARLAPAATGTDTGGSIRQPASFCGITGLKPTYGRVSRYGMIAYASSLDQAGPMAASAEDCAWLLQAMAGSDALDSTSAPQPVPDYTSALKQPLQGLRIGIPKEFFGEGLDPEVAACAQAALALYEKLGATLQDIDLPNALYAIPAYYILAPAECSSNLSRYDGVRFGHRAADYQDLQEMYAKSRGEGFGKEVKRRIMLGTYTLSSGYYDAYYRKARKVRRIITEDFLKAFEKVDVIAGPTTPTVAFSLGDDAKKDPVTMYLNDIYTAPVNLAGLPGISQPIGFVKNLPVGLQLIGNYFREDQLLAAVYQFQQMHDAHQKIPENYR